MNNFKLVLSYDGSRRKGWQKQGNTPDTIQEKLETVLGRILGQPVETAASGRTDAGVHARAQTVSFKTKKNISAEVLLRELRSALPPDIGAMSLEAVPLNFHARLSCTGKKYLYRIWNSDAPCVFDRKFVYTYRTPLDEKRMKEAASLILGTHDWSAFRSGKGNGKSAVRTLYGIDIAREGEELRLMYHGDGFLYNMVRILTGTLIEIGDGRREPEDILRVLQSGKREEAGYTVPPCGLWLWEVEYGEAGTAPQTERKAFN